MAQELQVHLYGAQLGSVRQDDYGRRTFTYDADYAQDAAMPPLSLSMPVGRATYTAKVIDPFMWGLLPDHEDVRAEWARHFGVSADNPFALLRRVGRDCAGGATFAGPDGDDEPSQAVPMSDTEIGERLRDLRRDPVGWAVSGERWSLAGAQSKFTLAQLPSGQWVETRGQLPSTHILKPGISEYRDQALVEHVSMSAARLLGLRAAKTEFREFAGEPALVVTRFDRRRARDGSIVRVHQEDACQALGVYPHRKYEASGGPSAAAVARLLRDNATDGEADVWEFAQALVFNYLIGAPDAHAKNYSIAHVPGLMRIAPLYDVASALPYDGSAGTEIGLSAMSIGGRRAFGTVAGRHWDRLADQVGVDRGRLRDEVSRQAGEIPAHVFHELEDFAAIELRDRMMPRLEQLCAASVGMLRD